MTADTATIIVWYAVRVRAESRCVTGGDFKDPARVPFRIEHLLRQKGFDVFMPRRTVWRFSNSFAKGKRQKREVPRPLLPGWLFVGMLPGDQRWRDLLDTPGVHSIAGNDGRPARVNTLAIRALAKRYGDGFVSAAERERFMRSRAEYAPGQQVRMADGPLEGMTARVVSVRGRHARILMSMFGADREVDVDAMMLEAA